MQADYITILKTIYIVAFNLKLQQLVDQNFTIDCNELTINLLWTAEILHRSDDIKPNFIEITSELREMLD